MNFRAFGAVAVAATMMVSSAFAADNTAPLAPGKPAGIHNAQIETSTTLLLLGAAVIIGGIVAVAASNSDNNGGLATGTTTTTTTT